DEQSQNYHWTQKTYQIIPLFHPAAVFYNYRLKEVVKEDWQVVQKQLQLLKKV
ncbi:uracil-DNA glycosylase, partial [Enterococcus faecalis]